MGEFDFDSLNAAVIKGNRVASRELTQALLQGGATPQQIVDRGLVPGMAVVGERFKRNEAFVPEMLIAARAMKEALQLIEPILVKSGFKPKFTAVIGTVQGDLHDIGKNLVGMMWRGANVEVVDLGTNVPADAFVNAARQHQARLIGLSALLTTTMPAMRETIRTLKSAGLNGTRVMVGGAPITESFAREIGADGFASDAASAVDIAMQLVPA